MAGIYEQKRLGIIEGLELERQAAARQRLRGGMEGGPESLALSNIMPTPPSKTEIPASTAEEKGRIVKEPKPKGLGITQEQPRYVPEDSAYGHLIKPQQPEYKPETAVERQEKRLRAGGHVNLADEAAYNIKNNPMSYEEVWTKMPHGGYERSIKMNKEASDQLKTLYGQMGKETPIGIEEAREERKVRREESSQSRQAAEDKIMARAERMLGNEQAKIYSADLKAVRQSQQDVQKREQAGRKLIQDLSPKDIEGNPNLIAGALNALKLQGGDIQHNKDAQGNIIESAYRGDDGKWHSITKGQDGQWTVADSKRLFNTVMNMVAEIQEE